MAKYLQAEQLSIVIITIALSLVMIVAGKKIEEGQKTGSFSRFTAGAVQLVKTIDEMVVNAMGPKYGRILSAYMGSVLIYLATANLSGLLGLEAPTTNLSVTLVFSAITWILIQTFSIKHNGFKNYLKGYLEPFALFLPMNIMSEVATLLSMALRLFGNLIAGSIIMSFVYMFTAYLSSFVPVIGQFDFIGPVLASVLHLYFDIFSGLMQAYIFFSLSIIFIGTNVTE
ncbi:F0F1 ATP synthase subunit A [Allofustis seminis]|uniref:F0F1 ATP synthase subunit A n=1 Tax=Allofustis seminis TaxID=166939 RepID=UPI00036EFE7B|nr:F0F1 ATP synthase subunit A [Allofustis seminis]